MGRGWHKHLKNAWVDGKPLPNTEEIGKAVTLSGRQHTGRWRWARWAAAGRSAHGMRAPTTSSGWHDVFPFLPKDFDERYYQAAPDDQQMPVPKGPLEVVLSGFTADGRAPVRAAAFRSAGARVPEARRARGLLTATLDTIAFEPDHERFTMSWRVARPLKKSMHEIAQVLVGRKGKEWWQQREQVAFPIPVIMVPMEERRRRRERAPA